MHIGDGIRHLQDRGPDSITTTSTGLQSGLLEACRHAVLNSSAQIYCSFDYVVRDTHGIRKKHVTIRS